MNFATQNESSQSRKLNDKHRAELFASGISESMIQFAGIYSANGEIKNILGWTASGLRTWGDGYVIPFCDLEGNESGYARVKLDFPRVDDKGRANKYESPLGKPNQIYFPPGFRHAL